MVVKRLANWIAVGVAAAVVIAVVAIGVVDWGSLGDSGISLNGWIALTLGVFVTLALGIGLMALVFLSNRRGYDELPRNDR